ncbi:MAG: hypothetical protein HS122_06340 [Opitutaceae bacterium]|nr:hypothetical protein [Opitutaceae bacterium]
MSTNADGSVTTIAHDVRGRKTSMVDPNMGTWEYRHNVFGELIWQKDAKLQVTTMTYDPLGRMKTQVQPLSQWEPGQFPQRTITGRTIRPPWARAGSLWCRMTLATRDICP